MSAPCKGCSEKAVVPCIPASRFDSVFVSDVNITQTGDQLYRIKFTNISAIILYQVWNEVDPTINTRRISVESNPGTWVKLFLENMPFEPTCIMAQPPQKWAFVIKSVEYTNCIMYWNVSTKPINNLSTTVNKGMIIGNYKKMRFDVDDITYIKNACPPPNSKANFDQILIGDVDITKVADQKYVIKFNKSSEVTVYQTWSLNNESRLIYNSSIQSWLDILNSNLPFEPTTVMELGKCRWVFVIKKAEIINNLMVWTVSTSEILNLSTAVTNGLKTGSFQNARFDVDSVQSLSADSSVVGYQATFNFNGNLCLGSDGNYYINSISGGTAIDMFGNQNLTFNSTPSTSQSTFPTFNNVSVSLNGNPSFTTNLTLTTYSLPAGSCK